MLVLAASAVSAQTATTGTAGTTTTGTTTAGTSTTGTTTAGTTTGTTGTTTPAPAPTTTACQPAQTVSSDDENDDEDSREQVRACFEALRAAAAGASHNFGQVVSGWAREDGEDRHDHHHDPNRHDERIRAVTLATETAIPAATFEMFIDLVRSLHGPKLLRLKGVVKIAEEPERPLVIHGVQHVMHPPVRLDAWPDADQRSRIVIITRDLEPQAVRGLFDAFLCRTAPDQPDRTALLDNPLVPFGGVDR